MGRSSAKRTIKCSFCGKSHAEVRKLITCENPDVCICDSCIGVCAQIIDKEFREPIVGSVTIDGRMVRCAHCKGDYFRATFSPVFLRFDSPADSLARDVTILTCFGCGQITTFAGRHEPKRAPLPRIRKDPAKKRS